MANDDIKRLANFYADEIERNRRLLFSVTKLKEMKNIQDKIKFYEERKSELFR
jgi:hypothetical protein